MLNLAAFSSVFANPTWDVLAVFFFVAAGFFYGISAGRARMTAVLLSIYISQLLFEYTRFINFFLEGRKIMEIFLLKAAVFFVLIIILSHFFIRNVFRPISEDSGIWWQIFLLSFSEVGLLISVVFRLLPAAELFTFSPLVSYFFASPNAHFWWLILPLFVLFAIIRRK
ncbi:MAG: hypothetical protein HYW71_03445 [Candidatus Niyogibacteria bacterium]|nr:hypothetical protein [Candidatus Niyogibacteria bacterium]